MTQLLNVAYSELTRVLPWSLRALGYSFGTADRGAHLVATAAAMDPAALDAMVRAQARPISRPTLRHTPGSLMIDAKGTSLLEIGPVAVDYLAAHADGAALRTCLITGATELSLLSAIVAGAAAYGLCGIVLIVGSGAAKWHLACPDGESSVLVTGDDLESLFALISGHEVIVERVKSLKDGTDTIMLIAGAAFPVFPGESGRIRPVDMVALAQAKGIPVSQET
jgi:hypothetical protein